MKKVEEKKKRKRISARKVERLVTNGLHKSNPQSDINEEDLEALGPKDLSMDMGDDEKLKHRTKKVDFAGKDLDIPGAELDDNEEAIGSEDEENNVYSLGGDNHEDLEEDKA